MLLLLGTTLTASFFDSLNPSAIAQQMLVQAMVKIKRHIWFFILGIGAANLLMGLAIYYGIATWVSKLLAQVVLVGYHHGDAFGCRLRHFYLVVDAVVGLCTYLYRGRA